MSHIVETEFKADPSTSIPTVPRVSIEPGRAIVGPAAFTLYEVGTVKPVVVGDGQVRPRVGRRWMSDNPRPAFTRPTVPRPSPITVPAAPPVVVRVVGKHCESGDIVVLDEWLQAMSARAT